MSNFIGYYESPIGVIKVVTDECFVRKVEFVDKVDIATVSPEILSKVLTQLDEYFKGYRMEFELDYVLEGTEFQKSVWKALSEIPYGSLVSYKDIADSINNPKACRAVGNANNKNKLSIIIPCHRVIGSNQRLIGYEWGLDRKQWLIEHEQRYKK